MFQFMVDTAKFEYKRQISKASEAEKALITGVHMLLKTNAASLKKWIISTMRKYPSAEGRSIKITLGGQRYQVAYWKSASKKYLSWKENYTKRVVHRYLSGQMSRSIVGRCEKRSSKRVVYYVGPNPANLGDKAPANVPIKLSESEQEFYQKLKKKVSRHRRYSEGIKFRSSRPPTKRYITLAEKWYYMEVGSKDIEFAIPRHLGKGDAISTTPVQAIGAAPLKVNTTVYEVTPPDKMHPRSRIARPLLIPLTPLITGLFKNIILSALGVVADLGLEQPQFYVGGGIMKHGSRYTPHTTAIKKFRDQEVSTGLFYDEESLSGLGYGFGQGVSFENYAGKVDEETYRSKYIKSRIKGRGQAPIVLYNFPSWVMIQFERMRRYMTVVE